MSRSPRDEEKHVVVRGDSVRGVPRKLSIPSSGRSAPHLAASRARTTRSTLELGCGPRGRAARAARQCANNWQSDSESRLGQKPPQEPLCVATPRFSNHRVEVTHVT